MYTSPSEGIGRFDISYGRVQSTDAGTYNIQIVPDGAKESGVLQGIHISSCMAGFFGFRECVLPSVGSRVAFVPSSVGKCYVLGTIPDADSGDVKYAYASAAGHGAGDSAADSQNRQDVYALTKLHLLNAGRPADFVEGEYGIANDFGVLLGLFQLFATLKASELAQVQCFVLDDLVRIVSHNFQHYSALGEHKIFHDGKRMHMETGMTHLPGESLGFPQPTSEDFTPSFEAGTYKSDHSSDMYNITKDERLVAVERLKNFVGALGDFVHLFLVRPTEENKHFLDGVEPEKIDKGLFDFHLAMDGACHIRTVKELFCEKTNWIRVPVRIRSPEDPAGDKAEELEYAQKPKFEFDDNFKFSNNPFLYALQLRDYLAYTQEELAYTHIKKHNKDFSLNTDYSKEPKLQDITKVDPTTEVRYVKANSGWYLMPNGGIMFRDAWGSAIIMEGGNISIQPAKDLVLQPLRHMVGKVGGNVSIAALDDVDVSSSAGGFRLKTAGAQHLYSSASGIILQSDLASDSSASFPADSPIDVISGIVFKSKSNIASLAKNISSHSTAQTVITADTNIMVEGKKRLWLSVSEENGTMGLFSKGNVSIESDRSMSVIARWNMRLFGAKATTVALEKQTIGLAVKGKNEKYPVEGVIKVKDALTYFDENTLVHASPFRIQAPIFFEDKSEDVILFRFLNSSSYNLKDTEDALPQTIAQVEGDQFKTINLRSWEERAINGTYPFPGKDLWDNFFVKNTAAPNCEKQGDDILPKVDSLGTNGTLTKSSMWLYQILQQ